MPDRQTDRHTNISLKIKTFDNCILFESTCLVKSDSIAFLAREVGGIYQSISFYRYLEFGEVF